MGNCFTLVYVLNQVSGSENKMFQDFSGLIDDSDRFLDSVFNGIEITAPNYLLDRVIEKVGNS